MIMQSDFICFEFFKTTIVVIVTCTFNCMTIRIATVTIILAIFGWTISFLDSIFLYVVNKDLFNATKVGNIIPIFKSILNLMYQFVEMSRQQYFLTPIDILVPFHFYESLQLLVN